MKTLFKIFALVTFTFSYHISFAQYEYLHLRFEISQPRIRYNHFEMNIFCKENKYFLTVKSLSNEKGTKIIDTTYCIRKDEFDEIIQAALAISSKDVINAMQPSDPYIFHDATACLLTIQVLSQEAVRYAVANPMANTDKRSLTTYLYVFRNALLLAKLSPNKILN
jgi:hypothetical protein